MTLYWGEPEDHINPPDIDMEYVIEDDEEDSDD